MDLPVAIVVTVAAAAAAFVLFAAVHAGRPGRLLVEATRGTPMATVAGTMFAVLLAFVIFAAFQTYNGARAAADSEAVAVLSMARTAEFYSPGQRAELRGELVCYARAVIDSEWPAMRRGQSSPLVDYWIDAYRNLFARLPVDTPRQQVALQELLTQASDRTQGRQQRLDEANSSVPTPLWLALLLGGAVTVLVQLGMADPRESRWVHGIMVAAVAALVTAGLLVVNFLAHPYQQHSGGIEPTAMRNAGASVIELEPGSPPPCTPDGRPAPGF